jgi:hypothetical protein
MTTLHERKGFDSYPVDRASDDAEAAFVLGEKDSDDRTKHAHAAVLDARRTVVTPPGMAESAPSPQISIDEAAMLDEPQDRFAAFVTTVLNGVRGTFARSPKRPKREKKHYPARFSIEFDTSLVDRERRRL